MGHFSAVLHSIAITAAIDLFEIAAPSNAAVKVHAFEFGQSEDAGDSESEQLSLLFFRSSTTGAGGTTVTPAPRNPSGAAFGGTVEVRNTTGAVEGELLWTGAFNVMAGYEKWWTPETAKEIAPSQLWVVRLTKAPGDYIAGQATVEFETIGG